MIVKSLKRIGKTNKYNVIIDDNTYKFNENIIVNYRLVKGKEVTDDILSKAIKENDYDTLYLKAERYTITYRKSEKEIIRYLKNKEASPNDIPLIISRLRKNKLIDDTNLVYDLINSLIKKYNGIKMIEAKLYQKGFEDDLIKKALSEIDYGFYCKYLELLYNKIRNKYDKYDDYKRINKIKAYLLQRGYTYSDIAKLNIK